VKEGLYLHTVIKPLYRFIRDQGYEVVDGRFVRREKDHADIIGYDDVNQLRTLERTDEDDRLCKVH
jgi:1,3-beta-glucan synthase